MKFWTNFKFIWLYSALQNHTNRLRKFFIRPIAWRRIAQSSAEKRRNKYSFLNFLFWLIDCTIIQISIIKSWHKHFSLLPSAHNTVQYSFFAFSTFAFRIRTGAFYTMKSYRPRFWFFKRKPLLITTII